MRVLTTFVAALSTWIVGPLGAQQSTAAIAQQCAALTLDQLLDAARAAPIQATRIDARRVLAGNAMATVTLSAAWKLGLAYCGRLGPTDRPVRIRSARPATDEQTATTALDLHLPSPGRFVYPSGELVLVAFPIDSATGRIVRSAPAVSLVEGVTLSHKAFAVLGAFVVVGLAYLLAVAAVGRKGATYSFDPIYLTAGTYGRASLSQFQIFAFTLLVVGLLTYVLLRTGVLTDISSDVLLLLGISAGGAAGSKIAGVLKKRLSFENWSWLRNEGWLTGFEQVVNGGKHRPKVQWSDLLTTDGEFDIYSFQLATVSLVVAVALLTSDLGQLATFNLPDNILALMGLSNAVFIGGKAVSPPSFGELDVKVTELRDASAAWHGAKAVLSAAESDPTPDRNAIAAARAEAAKRLETVRGAAREAARMVKALFGTKGSKFKTEPIQDAELLPELK